MGESTRAEAEAAGYEAGTQQAISLVDPLMSTRHLEMCTRKAASQWPRRAIGHMWESQSGSDAVGPWAGAGPSHTGSVAKRIKIKISTRRAVVRSLRSPLGIGAKGVTKMGENTFRG